jgi:S1-C subfamily serine protease
MQIQSGVKWIFLSFLLASLSLTSCTSSEPEGAPRKDPPPTMVGGVLSGGEIPEKKWRGVLNKAQNSVFKVKVETCTYKSTGSGFFIAETFLTNRHVVENAKSITLENGSGIKYEVDSWGYSKDTDLAWVNVQTRAPSLELAEKDAISGDLVANLGYPLGRKLTEERGRLVKLVSSDYPGYSKSDLVGVTSQALPGNSGGPLLDRNGKVIGVVVAIDRNQNLILAISLKEVKRFLANNPEKTEINKCG